MGCAVCETRFAVCGGKTKAGNACTKRAEPILFVLYSWQKNNMQNNRVTGIILAGGKSNRFGTDKTRFIYREKPLIEWVKEALVPVCCECVVGTGSPDRLGIEGLRNIPDRYENCGPLGGIFSCLEASRYADNLVAACDLPGLHPDLFRFLLQNSEGYQAVVPVHYGRVEPLVCYLHQSVLGVLEKQLQCGRYKLQDAFPLLRTRFPRVEGEAFYSSRLFANINTLSDAAL